MATLDTALANLRSLALQTLRPAQGEAIAKPAAPTAKKAPEVPVGAALYQSGKDVALFSTAARERALAVSAKQQSHELAFASVQALTNLGEEFAQAPTEAARANIASRIMDRWNQAMSAIRSSQAGVASKATATLTRQNPEALKALQGGDFKPAAQVLAPETFRALRLHEFVTDQLHRSDVYLSDARKGDVSRMINSLNFVLTA